MKYITILLLISFSSSLWAQNESTEKSERRIRGAIFMGNAHVPHATEGGKSVYVIPVWGLDIDYHFSEHWSFGIQTDIKVQSFEVERNNTVLKRSYPMAASAILHYHMKRHWTFYLGPGYEFEKEENIFMVKVGTEYGIELTEKFELGLNVMYENRNEIYDGFTIGVAFNFLLWE